MAVPKVPVPGSSLRNGPSGSSLRGGKKPDNMEDMPRITPGGPNKPPALKTGSVPNNAKAKIGAAGRMGGGFGGGPANNKAAALRRLMQKYGNR